MSHVQNLIDGAPNWLDILRDVYKIVVKTDGELVSLKYNQIESPMHEPIVQECRGMVVDVARRKVLAHPYNKFWNHGEQLAAAIDWETARVLEKLDGSLMTLYSDGTGWRVASSGTPLASGRFGDNEHETFGDAFWRTFDTLKMRTSWAQMARHCYMFEFCDEPNRIVVKHAKPRIVLHGARDMWMGTECGWSELQELATTYNWELVRSFPIASLEEALTLADLLNPIEAEGFVVVDAQFNRIKIKSPRYVALHQMKGEATPRRAIELWQRGETAEVLAHFPEFAPKIVPVQNDLEYLACAAVFACSKFGALSRKDFAAKVKERPYAAMAFKLFGRTPSLDDARALMRAATTPALERMREAMYAE